MKSNSNKAYEFKDGLVKGIPIGLGYLPVSFTFGIMVVSGGLSPWLAIFTSLSNLTSAGQFAGVQLIFAGAGYLEIALTTFVINMRYMLMSLALSQKVEPGTKLYQRLIFGFGITDEVFAIASVEKKKLTAEYMYGLMTCPIIGWTTGTALGAFTSGILPQRLADAMGIALYSMFIAIIIPPAKKSVPILVTILEAVAITCLFKYVSVFDFISDGFQIILATIIAAGISAVIFPVKEEEEDGNSNAVTEPDDGKSVKYNNYNNIDGKDTIKQKESYNENTGEQNKSGSQNITQQSEDEENKLVNECAGGQNEYGSGDTDKQDKNVDEENGELSENEQSKDEQNKKEMAEEGQVRE